MIEGLCKDPEAGASGLFIAEEETSAKACGEGAFDAGEDPDIFVMALIEGSNVSDYQP